jgi:hypothetical protein
MAGCESCTGACEIEMEDHCCCVTYNITINCQKFEINHEDQCTYVDNVDMRDSDE